jgi:hypothetical protein
MSCETIERIVGLLPVLTENSTNEEIANLFYEHILIFQDRCSGMIYQSIMFLKENHYEIWVELMMKIGKNV